MILIIARSCDFVYTCRYWRFSPLRNIESALSQRERFPNLQFFAR